MAFSKRSVDRLQPHPAASTPQATMPEASVARRLRRADPSEARISEVGRNTELLIEIEHWRGRAAEARAAAATLGDRVATEAILMIASRYDSLADAAEHYLARKRAVGPAGTPS
jgi:hypothetical protein